MRSLNIRYPLLAIGIMSLSAIGAGVLFFMLWRDYLLYAIATSALLLGAASLLPEKNTYLHGLSLGLCLGALVGGALGACKYLVPESTVTSNLSLEWTSASWPRSTSFVFSAPRGQLAPATQLQR